MDRPNRFEHFQKARLCTCRNPNRRKLPALLHEYECRTYQWAVYFERIRAKKAAIKEFAPNKKVYKPGEYRE